MVLSAASSPGYVLRSSKAKSGVLSPEKVVVNFSNISGLVEIVVISLVGAEGVGVDGTLDVWSDVLGRLVAGPEKINV